MTQTTYTLIQHSVKTNKSHIVQKGSVAHTRKWLIEHFDKSALYNLSKCGKLKFMSKVECRSVYLTPVSKRGQYYSLHINESK